MSAGTADPESVRTSITSMNALLDPLKHLYLNLADADGKTTRARCLFALADTGILDDLPCADVSADLGRGFCDDAEVEWTYEDFVNVLGAAIAHRTAHRKPLPSAPRGVPQRQLRDLFHLCCNDFDRARPKSNASRLTLHQWRVMCDGADLLTRRFTADASAVVFARCRKGPERDLGLDQFIACLAAAAAETGRTFESVVSAVSTSPLMTGGAENVPPAKEIGPAGDEGHVQDAREGEGANRLRGCQAKDPRSLVEDPGSLVEDPGRRDEDPRSLVEDPGGRVSSRGAVHVRARSRRRLARPRNLQNARHRRRRPPPPHRARDTPVLR
jgi:YD repeat-containing protein